MNRTKKETANENADAANDEAAKAEFDAAAAAKEAKPTVDTSDPWFAEFTVELNPVANSEPFKAYGEAVTFKVTRTRKGNYIASYGDVEGNDGRKAETAINKLIGSLKYRKEEFLNIADAVKEAEPAIPETAGGNEAPDAYFYDEEGNPFKAALDKVQDEVTAADTLLSGATRDTREGWLGFGRAYNKAKVIFADAGYVVASTDGKSEEAKKGNKAWGRWLETRFSGSDNVTKILESKNAAAQAGFYATAPEDVVSAFPDVNTASTFERKTNEIVAAFAAAVAEKLYTNRATAENVEFDGAAAMKAAIAKQESNIKDYDEAFAAWRKVADEAAQKPGKKIPEFAKARDKAGNTVIAWLLGNTDGQAKLDTALAKAWTNEVEKPTEEEAATEAADKATKAIAKKFPEMTVENAALHLLAILVSHGEAEDVYATLGDKLDDAITAKKAQADKAAEAAQEKASEDA